MPKTLIIVDVQNGFINEYTHHVPQRVLELVQSGDYDPVLFTRFINAPNSPYRRFLDWHACESAPETNIVPELDRLARQTRIFDKLGFTGMTAELATYLQENQIECACVVGIDTDMCVLKIALDLFDLGIKPIVLSDCCASTLGLQAHLAGLAILSRNIGADQIQDTGLGKGKMAAPPPEDTAP